MLWEDGQEARVEGGPKSTPAMKMERIQSRMLSEEQFVVGDFAGKTRRFSEVQGCKLVAH